jgi:hypothetical protein
VPVVARQGAFRLVVHARDHPPPHVHVKHGSNEVRVNLLTLEVMDPGPVPCGCVEAVLSHLDRLLRAWERYHRSRR